VRAGDSPSLLRLACHCLRSWLALIVRLLSTIRAHSWHWSPAITTRKHLAPSSAHLQRPQTVPRKPPALIDDGKHSRWTQLPRPAALSPFSSLAFPRLPAEHKAQSVGQLAGPPWHWQAHEDELASPKGEAWDWAEWARRRVGRPKAMSHARRCQTGALWPSARLSADSNGLGAHNLDCEKLGSAMQSEKVISSRKLGAQLEDELLVEVRKCERELRAIECGPNWAPLERLRANWAKQRRTERGELSESSQWLAVSNSSGSLAR